MCLFSIDEFKTIKDELEGFRKKQLEAEFESE